jgi:type II secretory pathway pseudopilin PulG
MRRFDSKGFTLIELLVSTAIIITATTVVVAILTSSFRGISRSTQAEAIRQNGNSAINRITRTIQFAESFEGVSVDGQDGSYSPTCLQSPSPNYRFIQVTHLDIPKVFSCRDFSIEENGEEKLLIDSSKYEVTDCSFTCQQPDSETPPIISLSFTISQVSAQTGEKLLSIPLKTTVKMRNL